MKKTLTLAAATLVVGAVGASAAVFNWDAPASDAVFGVNALDISGNWNPLTSSLGLEAAPGLTYWSVFAQGDVLMVGGKSVYVLSIEGTHTPPAPPYDPAQTWNGSIGLINLAGQSGTAQGSIEHNAYFGDDWTVKAWISAPGQMNFQVTASCEVPEPSSFAMIAGLGLVGFAAYRRMRA